MSARWRMDQRARRAVGALLGACLAIAGSPLGAGAAAPPPRISINDATVTEGNSGTANAVFTVSIARPPKSGTISVDYATSNGTATAGSDYQSRSGTLTLSKASPSATVSVPVIGDTTDEVNENYTVNLSNATGGATITDGIGLGTITDDDAPPSLSIDDVSIAEGDSGNGTATFTVSLSAASGKSITVAYATANGTASAPSDYASASGTLSFVADDTGETIDVTVKGDTVDEGDETFTVGLSGAVNASIADGTGLGTITDDDTPPAISVDDVSVSEGDSGTSTATFTVSLSEPSARTVTVDYRAADGTAFKPGDFLGTSGTLSFAAGETADTVDVTVNGDIANEDDELFYLNLSNPTRATIADAQGQGTIANDDPLPSLSVSDDTVTEGDSGTKTATFTVSLSAASGRTATVDYTTGDSTAVAPDDYTSKNGTLTFSAGQTSKTVSVTVAGDLLDEDDETFTLDLSGETSATVADGQGVGTIADNDATPSLSIDDVAVAEGDSGTKTATFTVSLSAASGRTVTADYTTADVTASAASDYTATAGTLTFASGETSRTIDVTIAGDGAPEGDETFTIDLSNATNAGLADGQGTGTVLEDDSAVAASVADVSAVEGSGTLSFVVTLSGPRGVTVTVDYGTADATASAGADYTAASGTVVFAPGETTATVGVTVAGDASDEPDETLTLDLSNPGNTTIDDGQGVGTILDDDKGPTTLMVKVTKRRTTLKVKGALSPAHAGKTVTVKLSKRRGSRYKKVASRKVRLSAAVDTDGDGILDSRYATSFRRLAAGRYKVTVTFGGDADHFSSSVSKISRV